MRKVVLAALFTLSLPAFAQTLDVATAQANVKAAEEAAASAIQKAQEAKLALEAAKAAVTNKSDAAARLAATAAQQKADEAKQSADKAQAAADDAKNVIGDKTDKFWENWGVGLSVSTKLGRRGQAVEEAQLVNGIVRVVSERDVVPRLMLERHWYFTYDFNNPHFRQGIFVGASLLGDKKLMDSVSLGWLVAFKPNKGDSAIHNLGFGIAVEPYSRALGDGIEPNKPLPAGETAIRYKEKNRMAAVVFYTFTPKL